MQFSSAGLRPETPHRIKTTQWVKTVYHTDNSETTRPAPQQPFMFLSKSWAQKPSPRCLHNSLVVAVITIGGTSERAEPSITGSSGRIMGMKKKKAWHVAPHFCPFFPLVPTETNYFTRSWSSIFTRHDTTAAAERRGERQTPCFQRLTFSLLCLLLVHASLKSLYVVFCCRLFFFIIILYRRREEKFECTGAVW